MAECMLGTGLESAWWASAWVWVSAASEWTFTSRSSSLPWWSFSPVWSLYRSSDVSGGERVRPSQRWWERSPACASSSYRKVTSTCNNFSRRMKHFIQAYESYVSMWYWDIFSCTSDWSGTLSLSDKKMKKSASNFSSFKNGKFDYTRFNLYLIN